MANRHSWLVAAVIALTALASCNGKKVYDSFVHNPLTGWERNDTVAFKVPAVKAEGTYGMVLKLRTDNSFPFTGVVLIVNQTIIPANKMYSDTLTCSLTDRRGHSLGKGVNLYQHEFRISDRQLSAGDSVYVTVHHNMMREILPGIADVGLMVNKE